MSFTPRQQGHYRPLVARAWTRHAEGEGINPKDKAARETWYREQLNAAANVESSKDLNAGRDFNLVMAHFETLCGDDIYWLLKLTTSDENRLRHAVQAIARDLDLDDAYIRATAGYVLRREITSLSDCTAAELQKVRIALSIHARRQRSAAASKRVRENGAPDCPF